MSDFATTLTPIIVLILLGYGLKRARFMSDEVWSGMEKLTYFVLFPVLLVRTLGKQTLAGAPWPSMLLLITVTLLVAATVLLVWHMLRSSVSGATFTSVFQGGVRFNTYIALAAAQGLFGAEGLALGSVAVGFLIVVINLLCISVFLVWGKMAVRGVMPFIREVIGNPLIIACMIGWVLSLSGVGLPGVTENILEIIGRAALPFG
ncbi:MAG: AEC family transporter, partial [Candidatus Competibacteraceae bacterium]|nr:AEC family transporter [Candidatus Competibacteraceae bacterium]